MADQIKISALTTFTGPLTTSSYVPIVTGGVTYKYVPSNYFVQKTGDETVAGVKTFSSSPVVPDATTATQAVNKGQIDSITAKTTPINALSIISSHTADGTPDIPDDVSGVTYVNDFIAWLLEWVINCKYNFSIFLYWFIS